MARFFTVRSQCEFDTPGERRFAERLEDDSSAAATSRSPKARYSNHVVLHLRSGILVLEVEDWKPATIRGTAVTVLKRQINLSPFRSLTKP
ncbi:NERD domain-containing protein [Pseudomonas songnenensis]|uniref:NERD domain-containing protein n=1 Tax=Pseudomonas songnenensis TaxID=1176259 RepID=UPI001A91E6BC|nr:NERD domain-containing protein [Pseudomonas songnenensis]